MTKQLFPLLIFLAFAVHASPSLVFTADFEKGVCGETADGTVILAGSRPELDASTNLPGIKGKGCLVDAEHPLVYPAAAMVNPLKGSLSFWIKPVDWEAGVREFRPLFWFGAEGAHRVLYYLLLTGNNGLPQASYFTRLTGKEMVAQFDFAKKDLFAKDKWTFVALNWNAWQIELFLNGRPAAMRSYSLPVDNYQVQNGFQLWFGNGKFWGKNLQYASIFDEIKVYNDIRTPQEIETEFLAQTAKVSLSKIPHCATVPFDAKAMDIVIDGDKAPGEWENATCFPLNKDFFQAHLLEEKSFLNLKYDQKNLYFLFQTDAFTVKLNEAFTRSEKAFSEDVFEIILRPRLAQSHTEPYSQIAISPSGFWALHHNKDWEAATQLKFATHTANGITSVEGMLPLSEIAPDFQDSQVFQAQFGYTLNSRTELSSQDRIRGWAHACSDDNPTYSVMYHFPEAMAELHFSPAGEYFQVASLGNILYGTPEIHLRSSGHATASIQLRNQKESLLNRELLSVQDEVVSAKLSSSMPLVCSIQAGTKANPTFFYEANVTIREPLQFQYEIFAKKSIMQIDLDVTGISEDGHALLKRQGVPGTALIRCKNAPSQTMGKIDFVLTQNRQKVDLPFCKMTEGVYILCLTLHVPGGKIEAEREFEVPKDDFLSQLRGQEREVFAPWTAVKSAASDTVSVIGREYHFDSLGFLKTATAWGENILAAPVEFLINRKGQPLQFRAVGPAQTLEQMPDRVVHAGEAVSADGQNTLRWTRTCEFDGMILYRIELPASPETPLELDNIKLRFRVSAIASRYLMAPGHIAAWDKNHTVSMQILPFYWLSGIRTGLDFFLPDDGNWQVPPDGKPVLFSRENVQDQATVECTILSKPVTATTPVVYTFGFLATPAKPLRPDWRKQHVAGWGLTDVQNVQDYWCYNEKTQQLLFPNKCLLSNVVSDQGAMAEVEIWHRKNVKLLPYSLHTSMPDNNSFYDFYGTEWRITQNGIPGGKSFRSKWMGKEFYMCSPVCPVSSYSKFLSWCVGNLMEKYGLDGVYLDGSQAGRCDNLLHGCGYTDAFGRKIFPYNDLGCRYSFRRLYQTIHGIKPDGILYTHANIMNAPHVHSMCDIILPGEELMPEIVGNPTMYTDKLPLERWQSSYNVAKLLGTNSVFLGMSLAYDQPMNKEPKNPRVSDPLISMCLVHDINLSGNFIYCKTMERIWKLWDNSGISDPETKFIGYWYPECSIRTDNSVLLASYYSFPKNDKLIIVIANPSSTSQSGKLILPAEFAGFSLAKARELYQEKELDVSMGVSLRDRDFQIIELRK